MKSWIVTAASLFAFREWNLSPNRNYTINIQGITHQNKLSRKAKITIYYGKWNTIFSNSNLLMLELKKVIVLVLVCLYQP